MPAQTFTPALAFVVAALILGEAASFASAADPKPAPIAWQDVGKLEIAGSLGRPLGTIVVVRGEWGQARDRSKPSAPMFVVTHVDGKRLKEPAEFAVVEPIHRPDKSFAREVAGVWELRGVEVGRGVFGRPSAEVLEAAGLPPRAEPPSFAMELHYITARQVARGGVRGGASIRQP